MKVCSRVGARVGSIKRTRFAPDVCAGLGRHVRWFVQVVARATCLAKRSVQSTTWPWSRCG